MIRCKQSGRTKFLYAVVIRCAVVFVLLPVLCMETMCGCAGNDKFVEIIVVSSDVVITPVPKLSEEVDGNTSLTDAPSDLVPVVWESENTERQEAEPVPKPTEEPAVLPDITPIPTITPIPFTIIVPLPSATPTLTPDVAVYEATPEPAFTPEPTLTSQPAVSPEATITLYPAAVPDMRLIDDELLALTAEYDKRRAEIESRYEEKLVPLKQSLSYMGEAPEDPAELSEYMGVKAEMEEAIAAYEAEQKEKLDTLKAEYDVLREEIYSRYGV